jgi:hypothetical protein
MAIRQRQVAGVAGDWMLLGSCDRLHVTARGGESGSRHSIEVISGKGQGTPQETASTGIAAYSDLGT